MVAVRRGLPDLKFINRKIPIVEVARVLDLRVSPNGHIHCWRPELHQNGDRTASVGIRGTNNTVKCFGCGVGPLNVVDLTMAVLGTKCPGDAARWIAARFPVPDFAPGKHLQQPKRTNVPYGFETDLGLLVLSGIWAQLSTTTHAIVPALLELGEQNGDQTRTVQISYRALARYGGVSSPNAIAGALRELQEIHWLSVIAGRREAGSGPVRETSSYLLTPRSDDFLERKGSPLS
jgi:hypothetical protein